MKKEFNKLRKELRYSELGWWFWDCFLLNNNKKERALANKLWDSLTKKEKELCEVL